MLARLRSLDDTALHSGETPPIDGKLRARGPAAASSPPLEIRIASGETYDVPALQSPLASKLSTLLGCPWALAGRWLCDKFEVSILHEPLEFRR